MKISDTFTPREREAAALLLAGCSNKEIAERLNASPRTVKFYFYHMFMKAGLHNSNRHKRIQLAALLIAEQFMVVSRSSEHVAQQGQTRSV